MDVTFDCVVVGAGCVGIAIARELARGGKAVALLEKERAFGTQTSARNSEVIHAGIYYPANSLKSRLCLRGRDLLYEYVKNRGINFKRCGKLILANGATEDANLVALISNARRAGANGLVKLSPGEASDLADGVKCTSAALSPNSGILDSHHFMQSLVVDFELDGGVMALNSPVTKIRAVDAGFLIEVANDSSWVVKAKFLINSAGLFAPEVSRTITSFPEHLIPKYQFFKGDYFKLQGRAHWNTLVYPMPDTNGLGIHYTFDLLGSAKFGPDSKKVEAIDYGVDERDVEKFKRQIAKYWPAVQDHTLLPDYAGIRPRLGSGTQDFLIQGPNTQKFEGLINLYGIESPGLTASLAIAEHVGQLIESYN